MNGAANWGKIVAGEGVLIFGVIVVNFRKKKEGLGFKGFLLAFSGSAGPHSSPYLSSIKSHFLNMGCSKSSENVGPGDGNIGDGNIVDKYRYVLILLDIESINTVRSTISELCVRRNGSASAMCGQIYPLGVCVCFGTMQVAGCQSGLALDGGFGRLAGSSSVDNLVYDRRPSVRFTFIRRSAI